MESILPGSRAQAVNACDRPQRTSSGRLRACRLGGTSTWLPCAVTRWTIGLAMCFGSVSKPNRRSSPRWNKHVASERIERSKPRVRMISDSVGSRSEVSGIGANYRAMRPAHATVTAGARLPLTVGRCELEAGHQFEPRQKRNRQPLGLRGTHGRVSAGTRGPLHDDLEERRRAVTWDRHIDEVDNPVETQRPVDAFANEQDGFDGV
jgi:hypothetical protein